MDNNTNQDQVWIPLANQEAMLAKLAKVSNQDGYPDFISWFNQLLQDNDIPISTDNGEVITAKVIGEHKNAVLPTVGDLMDWASNRTELYMPTRLENFKPAYLEIRDGVVGVTCDLVDKLSEAVAPTELKVAALFPAPVWEEAQFNAIKTASQSYKESALYSCNIIAFICATHS